MKTIKSFIFFLIITCALIAIGDFYLAWSDMIRGNYGRAFFWIVLGSIMMYLLRTNLKTLERIKENQKRNET